jgi:serine/threonine protein kinase
MCDYLLGESRQPKSPKNSVSEFSQSNRLNKRYRILKPIGQGGFGKTFLAVDENQENTQDTANSQHKLCVVKQFFPQGQSGDCNQKASELFQQESLRLAELGKHPQIPQLLDTFEQDGQKYLVQEWIDGQTLEQELAQAGAFNEVEIRQLLQDLLPVLQFVHEHNCIHRDIKPANIIRRQKDHQLVIVDFGASKYRNGIPETTATLIGSPEYAAPEQIQGKAIFASDLYSLGVTCLNLLTQISPFDLHDCSQDTWIWRLYLTEPIDPSLEQILCKLLQRATKRRYQSAAEVLADLNVRKHGGFPSQSTTSEIEDEDFETYFGFSRKENLPASVTSIAANLAIHDIAAVTIFDPQTQAWYYLPPKRERVTRAAIAPPVRDQTSLVVANRIMSNANKMQKWFFAAVLATSLTYLLITYFVLGISPWVNNHPRVEKLETSQ